MIGRPFNLRVDEEPFWRVIITFPDGDAGELEIRGVRQWKRVTAISHARYYAVKHPTCLVRVALVTP